MKIKKWKGLLTGIALVGATTPAISISVNKNNTSKITNNLSVLKNATSKTIVDYSLVEKMMSEVSLKSLNNQNNVELTIEQEQKVQELQQHYLDLFESNNYSLEEVLSYMCENFPQYKEEYEKQTKVLNLNNSHNLNNHFVIGKNNNLLKISPDIEEWIKRKQKEFKEKIPDLEYNRNVLITSCVIASTAAAAFYAAAWWFGITIPWAIACTMAATQFGILQDSLNKEILIIKEYTEIDVLYVIDYLEKLENEKNEIFKNLSKIQIACDVITGLMWIGGPTTGAISFACNITLNKVAKILLEVFLQHLCDVINIIFIK
ncbi:MAG: hypothetical protein SOT25_00930 [Malacoplasma sp.]|nr:hypothetical protein [Malacoplasma sp.]